MIVTEKQKEHIDKILSLLEGESFDHINEVLIYARSEAQKRSKLQPKENMLSHQVYPAPGGVAATVR